MVAEIKKGYDVVLGIRDFKKRHIPRYKAFVNYLGNIMTWMFYGLWVKDSQSGFRAYNQKALYALNINGSHTYTQESFQILAARKMRIKAIPVEVKYFKDRKSRVVTSIPKYMVLSIMNILRSFRDFAPLRFFIILGSVPFFVGLACDLFLGIYWLNTGEFTPYKFIGFTGLYLITLGIFLWSLGILADMQVRILNNQEKTYEELRRLSHRKLK